MPVTIQLNKYLVIAIVALIVVLFFSTSTCVAHFESFEGFLAPQEEYLKDLQVLEGYVGPYIGQVYLYLRNKYVDSVSGRPLPPEYIPQINDPTLADPILPIVRTQIKAWIDSANAGLVSKYGSQLISLAKTDKITYTDLAQGIIKVDLLKKGETTSFIV